MPVLLEMRGISKTFPGVRALDRVSFDLHAGEVHALVGENGAGKSTLIKILSGVYPADEGEILLDGRPVAVADPRTAQALGIAVIYQEPVLFPHLTVLDNLYMGRHLRRGRLLDWPAMRARAADVLASLDVALNLHEVVGRLGTAQQQQVAIARALLQDARVLVMDEPTAPLTQKDAATLFRLTRQIRERGVGVIFISHRLDEVFEVADRVTVLRDGRHMVTVPVADVTREELVRHMVGRTLAVLYPKSAPHPGAVALEVHGAGKGAVVRDVSFTVRYGEIVGLAGLVGSGRSTLARALFGLDPLDRGRVLVDGREVRITTPLQARQLGIAYIPEDRQRQGLVLPFSVRANLGLVVLHQLSRHGFVDDEVESRLAWEYGTRLDVRAPSLEVPVAQLSGGNQQKVVVGKWLAARPRVLIMDEPTRGIDVGAKAEMHRLMDGLASEGLAILLISSELPELLGMCDRVVVMHRGRLAGVLSRQEATQERVMALATGVG
jgi:rhamnose transport system ATP-binding protein